MDVLFERIKANAMTTCKAELFIFKFYRLGTNQVIIAKDI